MDGALATADKIADTGWRDEALIIIAKAQAVASDVDGALATADRIAEASASQRARALIFIAEAQAAAVGLPASLVCGS